MRNIAAVLKIGQNLLKKGRLLQDLIQLSKVILITDNELKETNYFFKKKKTLKISTEVDRILYYNGRILPKGISAVVK